MNEKTENLHQGHRKSVRQRYLKRGSLDDYADHQILEMLLFYAIPRRDVNPLAHRLINRFGSLKLVFKASVSDLCAEGISESTAVLIKLVGDIGSAIDHSEAYDIEIVNTDQAFKACHNLLFRQTAEVFAVLCLDSKNRVIKIAKRTDGFSDNVAALPRWIVDTAISVNASAVIIAHNHPSGSVMPSKNDIETTAAIQYLLNAIGIAMYDHVIVTHDSCYSMVRAYQRDDMFETLIDPAENKTDAADNAS